MLRPHLAFKLFLAILAACAVVALVYGLATHVFLRSTFVNYLNEQDARRMAELMPRVEAAYSAADGWGPIRGSRQATASPPLVADRRAAGKAPAGATLADEAAVAGAGPLHAQLDSIYRFALLDNDFSVVAGNPTAGRNDLLEPIMIDGQRVGWMAMVSFEKVMASAEGRFYSAQMRAWWMIGIASVMVAALLGWILSRGMVRRLRDTAEATHRLAVGDYDARIVPGARDEMGLLARDFNHLAQTLGANERARRQLMADISHELRTPLAILRAELEALQDGIRRPTESNLRALSQQTAQLGKLIDDVYDLSLTDVGALAYRRTPLDVSVVLLTAVEGLMGRFDARGISISAAPMHAGLVEADERRLQQLFTNILENTLSYTDTGGTARIRCEAKGDMLCVTFDDSGPGVASDQMERLFERFYRADGARARSSGGSGLGLAICRNIVQAHGGDIHAETSDLGGLRIVMQLPRCDQ